MKGLLFAAAALALAAPVLAAPPQVTGRAYVVENGVTGEVLAARDLHERVPIASVTKLMTVLLTVERTRPSDVVTVSARAAAVGESSAGLRAGERLTVRELLEAALIQSANDAADALADYVGKGSEERFVALMNRRAKQLGLRDTHYVRPDGLDATGHVSSARDVTLLARILMHRPLVRQIVRQRVASISGGRTLHTWNDLLSSYPGIFGVKTGHTSAAGWNEVAAARRGPVTVYATLLGSPDRDERNADLAKLLDWGFSRYRAATVVTKGHAYARAGVGYGREPVALVAPPRWRRRCGSTSRWSGGSSPWTRPSCPCPGDSPWARSGSTSAASSSGSCRSSPHAPSRVPAWPAASAGTRHVPSTT